MNVSDNIYKHLSKFTYILFIYGIGIFIPLYYEDYYFNMMEAKANAYNYLYRILLPLLLIVSILKIINRKFIFNKPFLQLSIVCLFTVCFISTYTSFSKAYAIDGSQGWMVGFYVIATSILTIFALKDVRIEDRRVFIPVYLTCFVIFALTIADTMELDLLKMNEDIARNSLHKYLTTLGNANWITGYLSLLLPYYVCSYIKEEDRLYKYLFLLICIVLLFGFAILDSDGIILALGFCSFFIIPFIFNNLKNIKRFSILLGTLGMILLMVKYLKVFKNFSRLVDGFSALLYKNITISSLLLLSVLLFVLAYFVKDYVYQKNKRYVIYLLEIFLVIITVGIIAYEFSNVSLESGNGRILIWRESLINYKDFNTHMKLFGTGPELLRNVYSNLSKTEGVIYNSAHSEPIQMLLTMGIMGLLSWISCYTSLFYYFFKEKDFTKIALYCGIFAYFAQSFVNSATVLNVATLSLFIIEILKKSC